MHVEKRVTPQDRRGRHQGIVCHSCGKEGHIARNCKDNRSEKQNFVCFSCGKRGHKARRCNSPKTKRKSYQVLLQKIHSLQTQLTLPQDKRPKEETINTWPDKSLLGENDCSSDTSSQYIGIPNDVDSSTHWTCVLYKKGGSVYLETCFKVVLFMFVLSMHVGYVEILVGKGGAILFFVYTISDTR